MKISSQKDGIWKEENSLLEELQTLLAKTEKANQFNMLPVSTQNFAVFYSLPLAMYMVSS
jgi:hypothetical protein